MAGFTRLLNALAAPSEVAQIGTAAWFGMLAAAAHVLHPSGHEARSSDSETGHGCDDSRQIIVLSHREPCIHDTTASGEIVARRPAGGLVAALEPVVRRYGGVWVAHGSGSADHLVADAHGHVAVDDAHSSYLLRRVWLTPDEERGYYRGFANEGLWPLCHRAFSAPLFRRADWTVYQRVNRRFANAVVSEIRTEQPIAWCRTTTSRSCQDSFVSSVRMPSPSPSGTSRGQMPNNLRCARTPPTLSTVCLAAISSGSRLRPTVKSFWTALRRSGGSDALIVNETA